MGGHGGYYFGGTGGRLLISSFSCPEYRWSLCTHFHAPTVPSTLTNGWFFAESFFPARSTCFLCDSQVFPFVSISFTIFLTSRIPDSENFSIRQNANASNALRHLWRVNLSKKDKLFLTTRQAKYTFTVVRSEKHGKLKSKTRDTEFGNVTRAMHASRKEKGVLTRRMPVVLRRDHVRDPHWQASRLAACRGTRKVRSGPH